MCTNNMQHRRRKLIILTFIAIVIILWQAKHIWNSEVLPSSADVPLGQLIIRAGQPVPELLTRPHSIWFLETSGRNQLSSRELCAVESAAMYNPNNTVYFLITNQRYLHLEDFFADSPLDDLWKTGSVHRSSWPVSHLSDLLRYLVLYKFGGTYLDTDSISLRSLPEFPNFVGVEYSSIGSLGAGALRFEKGHEIIKKIIERLSTEFDGSQWGWNGPGLLSSVMQESCHVTDLKSWPVSCSQVEIGEQDWFYAVNWRNVDLFFTGNLEYLETAYRNSYIAHIWGSKIRSRRLTAESPLFQLLRKHCPLTASYLIDD